LAVAHLEAFVSSTTTSADGELLHGEITGKIISAFYTVYDELGYGFLESVYRNAMVIELKERGLHVDIEVPIDVWYKGRIAGSYRADIVAGHLVVLELKASRLLDDSARKQLMNLLVATHFEVGLLLHFGSKASFERVIYENARKRRPVK
jgi:GxxExxY protein